VTILAPLVKLRAPIIGARRLDHFLFHEALANRLLLIIYWLIVESLVAYRKRHPLNLNFPNLPSMKILALLGLGGLMACGSNSSSIPTGALSGPSSVQVPADTVVSSAANTPQGALGASPNAAATNTSGRIGLSQIFDFSITATQKSADGPRYNVVWGANSPTAWRAKNPSLIAARYFIIEQSDSTHPLSYFTTYHPDWILYNCTSSGTPTRTPAYMQAGAYGTNAPLDIHNPAVISFQLNTLAIPPMLASGYNGLAADQVVFANIMGGNAGTGSYGCGVYQGSTFVRRYTSKSDSHWASDVVNWVKTAKSTLTPKGLKLVINHPAGSTASTLEQTLLANTDVALSEVGFSNYGGYTRSSTLFATALNYMNYTQAHGVTAMLIDKFVQSSALSPIQREWAIGTYLMGNNGNALLYATYGGYGTGGYGKEYYYPEYATNMGAPCGAVTGGPQIYQRKFANGLVIVNADLATHSASLSALHMYHDIEGRAVTNPLVVPPTNAFVMTTLAGTGCL